MPDFVTDLPGSGAEATVPLLSIQNLRVTLNTSRGKIAALNGVDLDIGSGEIIAIVGESGSGKTLTASAVVGLLPRPAAEVTQGRILFNGVSLLDATDRERQRILRHDIAFIVQNSLTSLNPTSTIGRQLADMIAFRNEVGRAQAMRDASRWLERVGIAEPERILASYPHKLSGGMKQRVLIAMAINSRPKLIIADEPTTALDTTTQKQVLDLLRDINRDYGTAILIITHDFGVVSYLGQRVAVMTQGRIVEDGETASILSAPTHPYSRMLIGAVPRFGRTPRTSRRYAPCSRGCGLMAMAGTDPLLQVSGLGRAFRARRGFLKPTRHEVHAVKDVDFVVQRGETVGLIGASGSGKSTLARLLVRLDEPTEGRILFDGLPIEHLPETALFDFRRRLQLIPQDASSSLNPRKRVGEQIAAPMVRFGIVRDRREAREAARALLRRVGLQPEDAARFPHEFSGGQRQRVNIARSLGVRAELLILDEPTSALDVSVQAQILELLKQLKQELGLTYLFIGHNLAVIHSFCDRILVMENGRCVEDLPADQLLEAHRQPATQRLVEAVLPFG